MFINKYDKKMFKIDFTEMLCFNYQVQNKVSALK